MELRSVYLKDETVGRPIDLIFTDPPYIDEDSLERYEGLSELGNRVLKDGGSYLCYVTQTMLHQVLNVMSENLEYYWVISIKHGGNNGRHGRGIFVEWKPILWFVKGKKKRSLEGIIVRKIAWGSLMFLASLSYVEGRTLVAVGSAKEFVQLQIQVVSSKRTHNYG